MATVTKGGPIVWNTPQDRIQPGGFLDVVIVGDASLGDAAITVTAHPLSGLVGQQLAVVRTVMRSSGSPNEHFIDIRIQNNSPFECPYTRVDLGIIRF
jgi:hypothetical protein